jgi:hypothetical protein
MWSWEVDRDFDIGMAWLLLTWNQKIGLERLDVDLGLDFIVFRNFC